MTAAPGSADPARPRLSVVVPAHDEERVLGRCLDAVYRQMGPDDVEVVVVANGCRDDTAAVARTHPGRPRVVELREGSKSAALNAGDAAVSVLPRVYLDADIELGPGALHALHRVLTGGQVHTAAPKPVFVTEGRPGLVRAYYRIWERLPFLREDPVGNGVYALSAAGRARFDRFPALTADDLFVLRHFSRSERACLDSCSFAVQTPRGLRQLLGVRTRAYYGALELAHATEGRLGPASASANPGKALLMLARRPADAWGVVVYAVIGLVAKNRAKQRWTRGLTAIWDRDDTTR